MKWDLDFISESDFENHIKNTILSYGEKLEPYDIKKFNKNIVDPIKLIIDRTVYGETWSELVASEIFRQRDKSNTNEIGYFHQRFFSYIANCKVPNNGEEDGWDVIYTPSHEIEIEHGEHVKRIFAEVKNKHNTMNSSSAGKTYIKMQNQLLHDDDCACFLVEAIASESQNKVWTTTVDGRKVSHKRIRRVSIDKFYEIVTGDKDAFLKICLALPDKVKKVLSETGDFKAPKDTVLNELVDISSKLNTPNNDEAMIMSLYLLGFKTYNGFNEYAKSITQKDNK